jgi:hypothetical protein
MRLEVHFENGVSKVFDDMPNSISMTVREALDYAKKQPPGLDVEFMSDRTGSTRIVSIDGVKPQGALDWTVAVNGESAGVVVEPSHLLGEERQKRLQEILTLSDSDQVVIRLEQP